MSNLSKTFRYVNENGGEITFEYDSGFLINKPVGIDTVSVNLNEAQGINQVGTTVQAVQIQSRVINVSGIIVGDMQDDMKTKLIAVIRPDLQAKLYADDWFLDVYPISTPTIEPIPCFANFQFSLRAPYPYWQKDQNTETVLSGIDEKFRLWDGDESHTTYGGGYGSWDLTQEYQFGARRAASFFNIVNSGQVPVPFTVTFTASAAVTNPKLASIRDSKNMLLNYEMVADEVVVVQITHDKTYVTSSVNGDIRGALSLASNFFELPIGDCILKPDAESGSDNLSVSISYATEIVGIAV